MIEWLKKQKEKSKAGYIMIWILLIFSCMVTTGTVLFASSGSAIASTEEQHNYQQAYYTAKSACISASKYILKNISDTDIMNQITSSQGTGTGDDGMGDFVVDVSYITDARIKVMATAKYNDEEATVSAYLITLPRPSGIIPTDNAVYINGDAATGFGQCKIYEGDIYVDGDLNIGQATTINGHIVVDGNLNVTGGSLTTDSVFCFGSVSVGGGGTIGELQCKGDLTMSGYGIIDGDAYVDGSLVMTGSGTINKDAMVQRNVTLSSGGNKIKGTLYYGGNVSVGWGSISSFAPNNSKISNYTLVDDSSYVSQELPIVAMPTQTKMPSLYQAVTISNQTISSSGTITSSVLSTINSTYGQTITLDCTSSDLYLRVSDLDFNLSSGAKLIVKTNGKNNVYFYLDGNSSFTICANVYVGLANSTDNPVPHLYIIGDNQPVSLLNNSTINAVIYIPNGLFTAGGSCNYSYSSLYKLIGCAIAGKVNLDNNVNFIYIEPDVEDTPLDIFNSPGSGSESGWKLESWGVN